MFSMQPVPGFVLPAPPGLMDAILGAGVPIEVRPDGVYAADPTKALSIQNSFNGLAGAQQYQLAAAAAERWRRMSAGHTTAAGIALSTDINSLSLITALYAAAQANAAGTFAFKDRAGNFQSLTAAQVTALYQDMCTWVQGFYSAEHALSQQIQAATTWQAVIAIDVTAGWPANS